MMLSLICLSALQTPTSTAADFFPSSPGIVRTYERKGKGDLLTNKIGDSLDMGGASVVPITENTGANGTTTYYRVQPDQVTIVAYDIKHPMVKPMPVLMLGKGEVTWNYEGSTASGVSGEQLRAFGKAKAGGRMLVKALGKKVDVVIVNLSVVVGSGMSAVMDDQYTVYGRGIGMIEQRTTQRLGKSKIEATYLLTGFEPAK